MRKSSGGFVALNPKLNPLKPKYETSVQMVAAGLSGAYGYMMPPAASAAVPAAAAAAMGGAPMLASSGGVVFSGGSSFVPDAQQVQKFKSTPHSASV